MRYDPRLVVYHERRDTYLGFAKQMEKYGRGRGQVMVRHPGSIRLPYLLPVALLVWLVSLPVLALVWSPWYLVTVGVYGLGLLAAGAAVALGMADRRATHWFKVAILGAALTFTVHACYGVGVVRGVVHRRRTPASRWREIGTEPGLAPTQPL